MTTLDQLYQSLSAHPDDWATRGIPAHRYGEEAQHATAACLRWMIQHRKRPYPSTRGTFHWFNAPRVTTDNDPESDIPEPVYRLLSEPGGLEHIFRTYTTLRAADEDFYAAWE